MDVQVLDEYGLPVSGEDVSFYVDGAFLGEATTDTSGVARIGFSLHRRKLTHSQRWQVV